MSANQPPSHLDAEDLKPGDEIEMYVFVNNDDGYDWEPATVLGITPLRVRWSDGSGEKSWTRMGARIPAIRARAVKDPAPTEARGDAPGLVVMWHHFATETRGDGWRCVWIGDDLDQALRERDQQRPAHEPGEAAIFALTELAGRTFERRVRR